MKRKMAQGPTVGKEAIENTSPTVARSVPVFPSDEAIRNWTMRNNYPLFDDEKALGWYRRHEAEFNADADEFLLSLQKRAKA